VLLTTSRFVLCTGNPVPAKLSSHPTATSLPTPQMKVAGPRFMSRHSPSRAGNGRSQRTEEESDVAPGWKGIVLHWADEIDGRRGQNRCEFLRSGHSQAAF